MTKRKDDYFGLCPHCMNYTGFVKAGATDVMYCKDHRVSWIFGSGNFSGGGKTEEEERAIYDETIGGFERIKPAFWPRNQKEKRSRRKIVAPSDDIPF